MSNFTFDINGFSDLYKDVHGVRPREHEFYDATTTDERRQEIWDYYCQMLDEELKREQNQKALAVEKFEDRLFRLIVLGAGDRETAIRWMADAYDPEMGELQIYEEIEFVLGLPYGYIKNSLGEAA